MTLVLAKWSDLQDEFKKYFRGMKRPLRRTSFTFNTSPFRHGHQDLFLFVESNNDAWVLYEAVGNRTWSYYVIGYDARTPDDGRPLIEYVLNLWLREQQSWQPETLRISLTVVHRLCELDVDGKCCENAQGYKYPVTQETQCVASLLEVNSGIKSDAQMTVKDVATGTHF